MIRLGYDPRGCLLQTTFIAMVLLISYLTTTPATNVNWVWGPSFSVPQSVVPATVYLLCCFVAYPLALYLPVHLAATRWLKEA